MTTGLTSAPKRTFVARLADWFRRSAGALALLCLSSVAAAEWGLNMTPGVTDVSVEVYKLHMLIFYICVAIAVVVFGAMIYSIFQHRKSKGVTPATFEGSTKVEIVWTSIPFIILIAMAIPSARALIQIEDTRAPDMTVKVTGYQWMWQYEYLDEGLNFYSNLAIDSNLARQLGSEIDPESVENYLLEVDKPLVVPVGKKVRILLTSNDVIHAWWVPALGGKKDAIPGFINEMWFKVNTPGIYRGQCAELCGKDHGFMPIVVTAMADADYQQWLDEQTGRTADLAEPADTGSAVTQTAVVDDRERSMDELMAAGEKSYITHCSACHMVNGAGMPPTFPALAGSAVATGDIAAHIDIILNGKAGTTMMAFGAQLSDFEIAAVTTYERNAWGNATGDVVQASDVRAQR
ncbi:MAG: cytochrome c oxidase subunit II [Gammaproteobacteria bacterium]|nr:cytochrome c oxidase subunit II [Gammaproteobacteria bacterium]